MATCSSCRSQRLLLLKEMVLLDGAAVPASASAALLLLLLVFPCAHLLSLAFPRDPVFLLAFSITCPCLSLLLFLASHWLSLLLVASHCLSLRLLASPPFSSLRLLRLLAALRSLGLLCFPELSMWLWLAACSTELPCAVPLPQALFLHTPLRNPEERFSVGGVTRRKVVDCRGCWCVPSCRALSCRSALPSSVWLGAIGSYVSPPGTYRTAMCMRASCALLSPQTGSRW